jgi:hypothetical protein
MHICKSGARTIDVTSVGTRLTSGSRAAATPPVANGCKWSAENFETVALKALAFHYPKAECFVVSRDVNTSIGRRYGDLNLSFVSLDSLVIILPPSLS